MGHLGALYARDSGRGSGLVLVPKLKFEHVQSLSLFSKMRVDPAAEVHVCFYCCTHYAVPIG